MTSNCSSEYSTSRRRGRKPTSRSEAWKKDHSQYESCSYDSLPLHPTANLQSRSPKTTKDFNLKLFRCTGSHSGGKAQKTIATKKKTQDTSKLIDDSATNTAYSVAFKPFVPDPDINRQAHFTYKSGSLQTSSALLPIATSIPAEKIVSRGEQSKNCNDKNNASTIKTNSNISTHIRTTTANVNRPLSIIQPDTNIHEIYKTEKQNFKSITGSTSSNPNKIEFSTLDATINKNKEEATTNTTINKNKEEATTNTTINKNKEEATINTAITEKEEETILNNIEDEHENNIANASKIQNEIQRFIAKKAIGQSTTLEETISKTLKNITIDIDSAINIDKLFFPNKDYNQLKIYIYLFF
ncbi:hypothetical protein O181_004558 [Austropuccinia psidii MF-1]|uniref:Uncharacterized protein n=1 Tax=Austropuccinia psidii MF-1 TaxID=1389203 RepID=A0A9Q3GEN4_9BASI|nr:hypothetical protein [Austropuccinia psidii MF-1]